MPICQLCLREFGQITGKHLKLAHNITLAEYKSQFPNAEIVSAEVREKLVAANKGKPKTEEAKAKASAKIKAQYENGRQPNITMLGKKDSPETLEKKRLAHLGKKHTEETKRKIGLKHKGKTISAAHIASMRAKALANPSRGMLGKTHSPATRAKLRKLRNPVSDKAAFKLYKGLVEYYSKPIREGYRKEGYVFGSENGKYQLDHIVPKKQGFELGIPAWIIGSELNCRVILAEENKAKNHTPQSQQMVETLINSFYKS